MKKIEYTRMAEREESYWWHVGRLKIIETQLNRFSKKPHKNNILNVGCGTGGTIPLLEKFGKVDNVDVSNDAIKFMKLKGFNRVTKVDGVKLPFKDASFDLLVAFDVLEHIKDDDAALKEWSRVIKDDGRIIITIPAYQWLWSGHDVSLHHFRRYAKNELHKKAHNAGLKSTNISYAIAFSVPLIIGFRFINHLLGKNIDSETSYVNIPKPINYIFIKILYIEAWWHKYINIPFGTSLIAVFQKTDA